jgi:hypothetical protein
MKPRAGISRPGRVTPGERALLLDEEVPEEEAFLEFLIDVKQLWLEHGEAATAEYARLHPGTRPSLWWRFSPPGPRLRVGGVGDPFPPWKPHLAFGIPTAWVTDEVVDYYNGQAVDVRGVPIGTEFQPGDFPHVAVDWSQPPQYEAQATYLERHRLLLPHERRRLGAAAFEPEVVERPPLDEDDDGELGDDEDARPGASPAI